MRHEHGAAYHILVVDDEPDWHEVLRLVFQGQGWKTDAAVNGENAIAKMHAAEYDLVICDLSMPGMNGLEVLRRARRAAPALPFIMLTGAGSIESAVESVRMGAYSYITKPVRNAEIIELARRGIEHGRLQAQLSRPRAAIPPRMICESRSMARIMDTVAKVAPTDATILITGESGTGKSRLAELAHDMSARSGKPFVTIDCAALPESLLESELFGHVKGAFTNATANRRGLLEEAQGGTVFLDEIGELAPYTQRKLLRAIQEHEIKPVGGNKNVKIDVRFIAATHHNLDEEVKSGRFRGDLFYRLSVIPIHLPPLRERLEELEQFAAFFMAKFNARYGKNITKVNPAVMDILRARPWHGNIRELENTLERAFLLTEGQELASEMLDGVFEPDMPSSAGGAGAFGKNMPAPLVEVVKNAEERALREALDACGGNKTRAAFMLGIGRRTLYDKLEGFGMLGKHGD